MKLFGPIASLLIAVPQTALGAGNADTDQGSATATVIAPIALNHVSGRSLSFGRFAVGGAGTVVVSPTGARTTTGGITPVSGGAVAADAFRVTGEPNRSYSIATASSTLTAPGGASLTFTTTPSAPTRTLRARGRSNFTVGGTLSVPASAPAGTYAGAYSVTVSYE